MTVVSIASAFSDRPRSLRATVLGLALVIGLQAFINMGVSLSVLPAKGMTLPLISYGGSSLFGVALTLGFALAVTRQRPVLPEEMTA